MRSLSNLEHGTEQSKVTSGESLSHNGNSEGTLRDSRPCGKENASEQRQETEAHPLLEMG